jgi:uncharacterized membrane protein (UPF0182 family)
MQQNAEVSELETLLGDEGTEVLYGNLVLVPIDNALLYVRPFYVRANSTQIPQITKVIVSFDGRIAFENTLQEGLIELFGAAPETLEEPDPSLDDELPDGETPPGNGEPPADGEPPIIPPPTGEEDVASLLAQANAAFDQAETALSSGDLGTYQQQVEAGRVLVARARELADPASVTTTTTTAAAPPPGSA